MNTLGVLLFAAVAFFGGLFLGGGLSNSAWKEQLVQNGRAEYYLDSHYDKQWRWK